MRRCAVTTVVPLCASLVLVSGAALPADTAREASSFVHTSWTAKDGFPGAALTIAQTTDGYLWIGGEAGLFRFDGVAIERYTPKEGRLHASTVLAPLFAAADGSLWVGHNQGGLTLLKDGKATNFGEREGLPTRQPRCLAQDQDGTIWAAVQDGLARFDGTRWHTVGADWNYPATTAWSVVVDHEGTLWAASADAVYALPRGEKRFRETGLSVRPGMLLVAPDDSLWMTELAAQTTTLLRKDAGRLTRSETIVHAADWRPLFDRHGGLWMGSWGNGALYVPDPRAARDVTFAKPTPGAESFREADGLTDDHVGFFFEDREGTIWVGTNGGLDRLRRRNLSWFALPPGAHDFSLIRGAPGEVLAAAQSAETFELPQRAVSKHAPTNVQFTYRDPDGVIWFSAYDGVPSHIHYSLYRWDGRELARVPMPEGIEYLNVRAMSKDTAGNFWVSVNLRGVYRLRDGEWTHVEVFKDAPKAMAEAAITDDTGRIWLAYAKRKQIAVVAGTSVQKTFAESDLAIGSVNLLALSNQRIWAAGESGVAFVDHDRFHRVVGNDGSTFSEVESIVATADDGVWLTAQQGIVHIPRDEVARVVADPAYRVSYAAYDETTDLPDRLQTVHFGNQDAVQASDGVMWFATRNGVARIDPRAIAKNVVPPPVTIRALSGDARDYPVGADGIRLPALTKEVRIVFRALSLAIPERVRFRYRLDGWDQDWREAGGRREAFYTNLAPGTYRFRVIAANNDGVWNERGAALAFSVAPAWYQTHWFTAAWVLTVAFAFVGFYQLRVRQLAHAMSARFDERLAERTRIARELHDTLLQSFQGLMLRFQSARNLLPGHPAKAGEALDVALDRADQAIAEGRDAIQNLRSSVAANNELAQLIATVAEELTSGDGASTATFHLSVEGSPRDLHPIIRDDVHRIARESLHNAFRHAHANRIEAEVTYSPRELRLRIRDDGQGIEPQHLSEGRAQHWGLTGMRERAAHIGAQLKLWSEVGAGTEVELRVPGGVAYTAPGGRHRRGDQR